MSKDKEKPQQDSKKTKVLSHVIQTIEKQFGKGAIMQMGQRPAERIPAIPSGSISLDQA